MNTAQRKATEALRLAMAQADNAGLALRVFDGAVLVCTVSPRLVGMKLEHRPRESQRLPNSQKRSMYPSVRCNELIEEKSFSCTPGPAVKPLGRVSRWTLIYVSARQGVRDGT